ncbi:MAG: hypothetical protein QW478_11680 [Candidatus Micrarchaeaceae archaeon]
MRGIYTYKITLSNTTSTATSPNLQVRLNINFSAIRGLSVDLGNIRFSSDQAGKNLLFAWLESAPQGTFTQSSSLSAYTSSNVWVNLGNNIIPANGSLNIYMQVFSSGTDFDGVYWGANPQWTNTYGQYDNGSKVFNSYYNFAGTSLPSNWTSYVSAGSVTVNNGVIIKGGTSQTGGENGIAFKVSGGIGSPPYIVDYATEQTTSPSGAPWAWSSVGLSNYLGSAYGYPNAGGSAILVAFQEGTNGQISFSTISGTATNGALAMPVGNVFTGVFTQEITATTYYTYYNYTQSTGFATSTTLGNTSLPFEIMVGNNEGSYAPGGQTIYWFRMRTYPPDGTDPVLTSIILLVGGYVSASIPVPDWKILKGKPYVTVSAKGISNGLSSIPNDGADFGPDTLGTQTSGIQEAINYVFGNGGGTIAFMDGLYDLTASPFQEFTGVGNTISPQTEYANIVIPANSNTNPTINISFVSLTKTHNATLGSSSFVLSSGGVVIQNRSVVTTGPSFVIGVTWVNNTTGGNNVNLWFDGISIVTSSNSTNVCGGLDVAGAFICNFGMIEILTDAPLNLISNYNNAIGLRWMIGDAQDDDMYGENIVIYGYYIGLNSDLPHAYVSWLDMHFCYIGIAGSYGSDYVGYIGRYEMQTCVYGFKTYQANHWVFGLFALGDQVTTGNFAFSALGWISNEYSSNPTSILILSLDLGSNDAINPVVLNQSTANGFVKIANFTQRQNSPYFPAPTLSANPPASATVYQNTNPYDIRIYLPAYATTSGTAGSVAIALGSSSSPSTIGTKFVNGSTSSSATEIIELVVPAGWYYEFTSTGVTFGTATVLPA